MYVCVILVPVALPGTVLVLLDHIIIFAGGHKSAHKLAAVIHPGTPPQEEEAPCSQSQKRFGGILRSQSKGQNIHRSGYRQQ